MPGTHHLRERPFSNARLLLDVRQPAALEDFLDVGQFVCRRRRLERRGSSPEAAMRILSSTWEVFSQEALVGRFARREFAATQVANDAGPYSRGSRGSPRKLLDRT